MALLGMMAVHVFETLRSDKTASHMHVYLAGHALATFVLLAGVSLTFMTRRSRSRSVWPDVPTALSLATRALLIGLIGLSLNMADLPEEDILPYYGLMFLLAIPLVRLPSRACSASALRWLCLRRWRCWPASTPT
jgi:uncharacterized membrane protein